MFTKKKDKTIIRWNREKWKISLYMAHVSQLIYYFLRDGFGTADFHRCCDSKGPTLSVIQSTGGYLFGGYTPLSWNGTNTFKNCSESFIFTLTNPHNIPPTKYHRNPQSQSAIYCDPAYGPTFGDGCTLWFTIIPTRKALKIIPILPQQKIT